MESSHSPCTIWMAYDASGLVLWSSGGDATLLGGHLAHASAMARGNCRLHESLPAVVVDSDPGLNS